MSQTKIYVGNLSYDTNTEDLQGFFAGYGDIAEAIVITDRDTGRSRGFGFVNFADQQFAQAALEANGAEFMGRKLRVNLAEEDGRRGGGNRSKSRGGW